MPTDKAGAKAIVLAFCQNVGPTDEGCKYQCTQRNKILYHKTSSGFNNVYRHVCNCFAGNDETKMQQMYQAKKKECGVRALNRPKTVPDRLFKIDAVTNRLFAHVTKDDVTSFNLRNNFAPIKCNKVLYIVIFS